MYEGCSKIEQRIARSLVHALFREVPECRIRVYDGEEMTGLLTTKKAVIDAIGETSHDTLHVYSSNGHMGVIVLIWGNDIDLISDFSDRPELSRIVDPVIERYQQ